MQSGFALILAVAGLLAACSPAPSASKPDVAPAPAAVATAAPATNADSSTTQDYDGTGEGIPVVTRYPAGMVASATASSEGAGVFFTFAAQGNALDQAHVHVFLPAGVATAAEQEALVTGPNGLLANNGWTVIGRSAPATDRFAYAWVETVIDFRAAEGQSGHVLLGRSGGGAVQVTLLYPEAMADAYWPSARTVLDSLAFPARVSGAATAPGETTAAQDATGSVVSGLGGTSWSLVEIASMDDSVYRPAEGARYELSFQPDGSLLVQADCNSGHGTWQPSPPSGLTIGPIATTRMACPPGSIDARYLADLGYVRSYVVRDGQLFLATMADGSILEFRPRDDSAAGD